MTQHDSRDPHDACEPAHRPQPGSAPLRNGSHHHRLHWNPEISLGSVISLIVMLAAGYTFLASMQIANERQDLLIAQAQIEYAANRADVKASMTELQRQVRALELAVRELQTELRAARGVRQP